MIILKSPREIEMIRAASKAAFEVHLALSEIVRPGVSTLHIERRIVELMERLQVEPAYKKHGKFPAAAYVDVNDAVCHNLPSKRTLRDGDIVKIGVGVVRERYHADKTVTYAIGHISDHAARLIAATNETMWRAISECRPGNRLANVSQAIQTSAEGAGYSTVRAFVGHGIGNAHHEEPAIPNVVMPSSAGPALKTGPTLKTGMVIKPHVMLNAGKWEVRILDDGWGVVTLDGSLSACATETIAVGDDGPDVLTGLTGLFGWRERFNYPRIERELTAGELICGERIEQVISGGMGTVYLTERHAFKGLLATNSVGEDWRHFAGEIETWLRLPEHPNVVRAFTIVPSDGRPFLVLERIRGHDLRRVIERDHYTVGQVLMWACQVCAAMAFVHKARGLVHRDLKPANVLIGPDSVARVTDFGIAVERWRERRWGREERAGGPAGSGAGTPAYMAPEQWAGTAEVDTRVDIYSFGILLYELLCRRHPFAEALGSENELLYRHLGEEPADIREYVPELPSALAGIVRKCVAKDPGHRFQAFAELEEEIQRMAAQGDRRAVPRRSDHEIPPPGTKRSSSPAVQRRSRESLREWIADGQCADVSVGLQVAVQVAHALVSRHTKGVFGGVMPEAILIDANGTAAISSSAESDGVTRHRVTQGYLPPERMTTTGGFDAKSDIFGFGVCLYEMFCGQPPYLAVRGSHGVPADPKELRDNGDLPDRLCALLKQCVECEPGRRPESMERIKDELREIFRDL